jgi:hypothetical protein
MTIFPRAELPVKIEDIPVLQNGGQQIYLGGCVAYRDAFEQTWSIEFRFRSAFFEAPRWFMQPTSEGSEERPGTCGPRLGQISPPDGRSSYVDGVQAPAVR